MTDYKNLIKRLIALSNHEHDDLSIGCEAADAIQNLDIAYHLEKADHERTKEELAALKQKIASAEPVIEAAKNLIAQKGRYHTEQAYKQLAGALEWIKE